VSLKTSYSKIEFEFLYKTHLKRKNNQTKSNQIPHKNLHTEYKRIQQNKLEKKRKLIKK